MLAAAAIPGIRGSCLERARTRNEASSTWWKKGRGYCSFAYSALASFRMGMSGSAPIQRVKKSW
jgi:hypothetical protein